MVVDLFSRLSSHPANYGIVSASDVRAVLFGLAQACGLGVAVGCHVSGEVPSTNLEYVCRRRVRTCVAPHAELRADRGQGTA